MDWSKISPANWKVILALSALSFVLCLLISPVNRTGDIAVHDEWGTTLYQQGLSGSYFRDGWTYTPPTQPPIMMLSFWLSRHIYENRYILSELHNLIKIPPAVFIIWFDQNGYFFLLKLWAIIGNFLNAFVASLFVYSQTRKKFLSAITYLLAIFSPLAIYESAHWGQNDIIGTVFIYLALLVVNNVRYSFLTLPLLLIGASVKPTVLAVLPLFFLFFIKNINFKYLANMSLGFVLSLIILASSFIPFVPSGKSFVAEAVNISKNRIAPSSKGIVRASNSAFNFYSLFYTLDTTPGSKEFLFTDLQGLGYIFICLILLMVSYLYFQHSGPGLQLFLIYIYSQGFFLFSTGMLERYFFPAYLASVVLMVTNYRGLRIPLVLQNIIWLLNLLFPRSQSLFLVKSLSALSLVNYFLVLYLFLKRPRFPGSA